MFKFILLVIRFLLSKIPQVQKDFLDELLTLRLENSILKRKLDSRNTKIKFSRLQKFIYSLLYAFSSKFRSFCSLVKPKTVLTWYTNFVKNKWTYPSPKKPGRPPTPQDIKDLILQMKNQNISWGNKKIQGELLKLGTKLDKNTIAKIILDFRKHGKLKTGDSWRNFIKRHLETMHAMDFFTITPVFGKVCYVFFIIALKTREIVKIKVLENPNSVIIRAQLEDWRENKENEKVYLIHDNDAIFKSVYYKDLGIKNVKTSVHAPNMNAYAERFVRTIRNEALDWFVIFNYGQLERILSEYIAYYNTQRPHQGIEQQVPSGYVPQKKGKVISHPVLSGLHHHYDRKAS